MSKITLMLADSDDTDAMDEFATASIPGIGDVKLILQKDQYGELKLIDTLFFPMKEWQTLRSKLLIRISKCQTAAAEFTDRADGMKQALQEFEEALGG